MDRMLEYRLSRRRFLAATAAGSAAVILGGGGSAVMAKPTVLTQPEDAPWFEASIRDLRKLMARRKLSSVELTQAYLDRIEKLNPTLHAVIQTNPDALDIASRRDRNAARGIQPCLDRRPVVAGVALARADHFGGGGLTQHESAGAKADDHHQEHGGCPQSIDPQHRRRHQRHPRRPRDRGRRRSARRSK